MSAADPDHPIAKLRAACERLLEYVENQLALDDSLPAYARDEAPVSTLSAALGREDVAALIAAGRAAACWIVQNASDEERWEWATGCPHPDIEEFEWAACVLDDEDLPA